MKIGEKIRNAREDADITQTKMAEMIGMNQSNYSKIERDIQEPDMDQFKRICEILKLNPNYLLQINEYKNISAEDMQLLKEVRGLIEKYK